MSKYKSKINDELELQIKNFIVDGKTTPEISTITGISSPGLRAWAKRTGQQLISGKVAAKKIILSCVSCQKSFEKLKTSRIKTCSAECSTALRSSNKQKYSEESINQTVELKRQGKTMKEIMCVTGMTRDAVKRYTRKRNAFLSDSQKTKNSQDGKFAKNPLHMEHMRKGITDDVIIKRSKVIADYYSTPSAKIELFKQENSKRTIAFWKKINADPKAKSEYMAKRNESLSEVRTGMSKHEQNVFFEEIKKRVDGGEFVTEIAKEVSVSASTIYRNFHKRGWQDSLAKFVSIAQTEIFNFVKSITQDRVLLSEKVEGKEFDVYVPSLKFAIEYDGLFWHSSAKPEYVRSNHFYKYKTAEQLGINLLVIREHEWRDKKELVKKMIEHRLGLSKSLKLRASDLELVELKYNHQFEIFFNAFHLDGHSQASFALALKKDDKIVFCCSFRVNERKEFEIARMANDYNYAVHGGFSRVIKNVISLGAKKLITFSNNRLSHGNVYKQNGFVLTTETQGYGYTDLKNIYSRYKCRKINDRAVTEFFPTERSQAEAGLFSQELFGDDRPLYRIEDYGNKKWEKIIE